MGQQVSGDHNHKQNADGNCRDLHRGESSEELAEP
jgi:hypothetical protein